MGVGLLRQRVRLALGPQRLPVLHARPQQRRGAQVLPLRPRVVLQVRHIGDTAAIDLTMHHPQLLRVQPERRVPRVSARQRLLPRHRVGAVEGGLLPEGRQDDGQEPGLRRPQQHEAVADEVNGLLQNVFAKTMIMLLIDPTYTFGQLQYRHMHRDQSLYVSFLSKSFEIPS